MLIRTKEGTFKEVSRTIPKSAPRKETEKDKITNERQSVIKQFVERLNTERRGTKYPELAPSAVAVKLSHLSLQDLYFLLKRANQAKSFSSYFWWSIKAEDSGGRTKLF